jgi:hypothetical protein
MENNLTETTSEGEINHILIFMKNKRVTTAVSLWLHCPSVVFKQSIAEIYCSRKFNIWKKKYNKSGGKNNK